MASGSDSDVPPDDFNPFSTDLDLDPTTPEFLESNAKKLKLSENPEGTGTIVSGTGGGHRVFGASNSKVNIIGGTGTGTGTTPTRRLLGLGGGTGLSAAPKDKGDGLLDDDILFGTQSPDSSPEPTKKVVPTTPVKMEQALLSGTVIGYENRSTKAVSPIGGHSIGTGSTNGTGANLNRVPKRTVADLDKSLDELIYDQSNISDSGFSVNRTGPGRQGTSFSRFVTDIDREFSDESEEYEYSSSGSGLYGKSGHFARSAGITPQHQTHHDVPTTGIVLLQQRQPVISNGAVGMTGSPIETIPKDIRHYWHQRYELFTKYDDGIQLDKESWYSVTPECIAHHQASRAYECLGKDSQRAKDKLVILDAFAGCGGNSIQFAKYFKNVISVDIDPFKTAMAKNNAKVYDVEKNITFVTANFYDILPLLSSTGKIDGIFLSPPWGGPKYNSRSEFLLNEMDGWNIFNLCKKISPNIIFYCPRNINKNDLVKCAGPGKSVEIEDNNFQGHPKAVSAYYGKFIRGDLIKSD